LAQAPVQITEAVIEGLQGDPSIDPEVLEIALNELVPAIQADSRCLEAERVGAILEAICNGCPLEKIPGSQGEWQEHDHSMRLHPFEGIHPFEYERPERERQEHDHSTHSHES
jgi:hypothetical protein